MLARVQTSASPLPQKKSGEETFPYFSVFSRFYLREGGRLYTGYDHASSALFLLVLKTNKQTKTKKKRLISTRSQAVSYITQVALFFLLSMSSFFS